MGALHCVTDNHMHVYTARTSGEIEDMGHPLRLRTATRGFATLDQINTGCTVCPGGTGRNSRVWLQVCIGCRVYVYVLRTALRVPEVCTFANNNRGLSTTQFHGRNASPSHSSHWNGGERRMSATGGKGPWAKLSGRRARSARGFGG